MFADLGRTGRHPLQPGHTHHRQLRRGGARPVGREPRARARHPGRPRRVGARRRASDGRHRGAPPSPPGTARSGCARPASSTPAATPPSTWEAGLPCRVPERTVWGSQQIRLENLPRSSSPSPPSWSPGSRRRPSEYGLRPPRRPRVLLPRPEHRGDEHDPRRGAARRGPGAPRRSSKGGPRPTASWSSCAPSSPRRSARRKVRCYGFPGRRQTRWIAAVHQLSAGRGPRRRPVRGRGRPHGVADRAARPGRGIRVGDVRPRPRALRPAAQPDPAGRAQPRRRRPLRRRRRRRPVQRPGDGALRGDGRRRRARAGPRGRAAASRRSTRPSCASRVHDNVDS